MKVFFKNNNFPNIIGAGVTLLFFGRILSPQIRVFGDNELHLRYIYEAYYEISSGHFPLRVASHQLLEQGYMTFQYSCNMFYTIMGLIAAAVVTVTGRMLTDGTVVWLVYSYSQLAVFYIAFIYMCKISKFLGADSDGAVASGVLYCVAPYMLTNVFSRGAVTEAFALYLLPVLVYHLLMFCSGHSSRKSVILIPGLVAIIVGTHFSTAFYLFFTLFIFSFFSFDLRKILFAIGLISLGILIDSFFLFSSLIEPVRISSLGNPGKYLFLLSKWYMPLKTNYVSGLDPVTPSFQVGIGSLAAVPPLLIAITQQRKKVLFGFAIILLCLYSLLFFDVAAWNLLPKAFWLPQFSYRLLGLIVFWSSISLPLTLNASSTIGKYLLILICLFTIGVGFSYVNSGRGLVAPSSVNNTPQLPWNTSDYLPVAHKSYLEINDGKFSIPDNLLYRDRHIDIQFKKHLNSNIDIYLDTRGWLEHNNCDTNEHIIRFLKIDGGTLSSVDCYRGHMVLHITSEANNQSIRIATHAIPDSFASSFGHRTAPRLILAISPDPSKRWLYFPQDGFNDNFASAQKNIKESNKSNFMLILPQIAYVNFSTVLLNGRKVNPGVVNVNDVPLNVIEAHDDDSVVFFSHGNFLLDLISVLASFVYIIVIIVSIWGDRRKKVAHRIASSTAWRVALGD